MRILKGFILALLVIAAVYLWGGLWAFVALQLPIPPEYVKIAANVMAITPILTYLLATVSIEIVKKDSHDEK